MSVHLRGRENALELFGWTGRRAEWVALACLHGGVFTRAQWTRFLGCHTEKVRRAVHALIAQGVATEENVSGITGIGRVCRVYGRDIYRALGAEDIRRRRITSTEVLVRRLLSRDYVLEHPHLPWLPTEHEKVGRRDYRLGYSLGVLRQEGLDFELDISADASRSPSAISALEEIRTGTSRLDVVLDHVHQRRLDGGGDGRRSAIRTRRRDERGASPPPASSAPHVPLPLGGSEGAQPPASPCRGPAKRGPKG